MAPELLSTSGKGLHLEGVHTTSSSRHSFYLNQTSHAILIQSLFSKISCWFCFLSFLYLHKDCPPPHSLQDSCSDNSGNTITMGNCCSHGIEDERHPPQVNQRIFPPEISLIQPHGSTNFFLLSPPSFFLSFNGAEKPNYHKKASERTPLLGSGGGPSINDDHGYALPCILASMTSLGDSAANHWLSPGGVCRSGT